MSHSALTKSILAKTKLIATEPEVTPGDHGFEMFTDAGTEVEVSEFLYALVGMLKPKVILETGCHKGISATFMGQALKDADRGGQLYTCEIFQEHVDYANRLFKEVGVDKFVNVQKKESLSLQFPEGTQFDMMFLDSEPWLRFDEFVKYFPMLKPGGFILIHDLGPTLGRHGQVHRDILDWPYGEWKPKLGDFIKNHEVQTMNFPTPRGLVMFQKRKDDMDYSNYLKEV